MSLPVQPRGPWVWAVYWSWQLVPLDSYQNVLGGASMKQGQDGTVPNIVSQKSRVGGGGVCPGKGQLPLPGVQRTQLALAVLSQGVWEPSCHSALKGNALRVEGNHIPSSGFHRDGRQAAWLLPVSAKCDCNRRTFVLWVILPVAV